MHMPGTHLCVIHARLSARAAAGRRSVAMARREPDNIVSQAAPSSAEGTLRSVLEWKHVAVETCKPAPGFAVAFAFPIAVALGMCPCLAIAYHAMPRHASPCHAMPCHAMPCHAVQSADRHSAAPVPLSVGTDGPHRPLAEEALHRRRALIARIVDDGSIPEHRCAE
jgi:hypothetical protein